jgi:cytochrome c-type biogenesis protein CcmH/NrfG
MLGEARFERGGSDMVDSIQAMRAAMKSGSTDMTTYIVAAEACRRMNRLKDSADILRDALRLYPGNLQVLNNLAFTLSADAETVPEAVSFVPRLLKSGSDNLEVLDTVAAVHIRAGDAEKAEEAVRRIEAILDSTDNAANSTAETSSIRLRTRIHTAEIALVRDDPDLAFLTLSGVFEGGGANVADDDVGEITRILGEAEGRLYDRQK